MSQSMPWLRQVWHVFAKDVQRQRWMLLLFTVHAFVGTLAATMTLYSPIDSISLLLLIFSLPITAAMLAAMVILDDAPTSACAWWPTLALSRQAVFTAKLLFVLGIMPLVLITAMVFLHRSLDVPTAQSIVLSLVGVRWIVLTLTVVIAVAALQKDLRAFVLVAVLLLGALFFSLEVLLQVSGRLLQSNVRITPAAYLLAMVLIVAVMLLATSRVYQKRRQTRYWSAAVLLLAPALLLLQVSVATATTRPTDDQSYPGVEQAKLEINVRKVIGGVERLSGFSTRVQLKALATQVQAAMYLPSIQLTGGGNCRAVITRGEPFSVLHSPALPIPGNAVSWRGAAPNVTYSRDTLYTRTFGPYPQVPADCALAPRAELHLREPRLLGSVPLTLGASLTRDGYRTVLLGVNGEEDASLSKQQARGLVTAGELSSFPAHRETSAERRPLSYVLLHPVLREAVQLQPTNRGSFARRGPLSQAVVDLRPLPDVSGPQTRLADSPNEWWQQLRFSSEAAFDDWLRGTELLVFEWKLVAVIEADVLSGAEQTRAEDEAITPLERQR